MLIKKWQLLRGNYIINLPSSKSISNRLLIFNALASNKINIENLSVSDDSLFLLSCLKSDSIKINVGDGGTTLRFLLAYYFITSQHKIIYASKNLSSRPHMSLFVALESLGAKFNFLEKKNHLPVEILPSEINSNLEELSISAEVSSQYISSIMMIAPYLNKGLKIIWNQKPVSFPYIRMTEKLMEQNGIKLSQKNSTIHVYPGSYIMHTNFVESDWSAASFFYAFVALSPINTSVQLPFLINSQIQADQIIENICSHWGVISYFEENKTILVKSNNQIPLEIHVDFNDNPDIFPVLSILCFITKTKLIAKNVQHLIYKESNRLQHIADFVSQNGSIISKESKESVIDIIIDNALAIIKEYYSVDSYGDHRMAMAFSLISLKAEIEITQPNVTSKSFPNYWEQLKVLGAPII